MLLLPSIKVNLLVLLVILFSTHFFRSSFLLLAHFTGNHLFTPFHWLDTHTLTLPADATDLLTQINSPNEAFHQKLAYKRRSQWHSVQVEPY